MKISKFLRGISAFIIAGVLSFMPTNQVKAVANPTVAFQPTTHTVYLLTQNGLSTMTGTINWSVSGVDWNNNAVVVDPLQPLSGQFFCFAIDPDGTCAVVANISLYNTPVIPTPTGIVSYSFEYNGRTISGSLPIRGRADINGMMMITLSDDSSSEFSKAINSKVNDIDMAFRGLNPDGTVNENKTVDYNYNYAINEKIIEKLAQADGVTLLYTFEYEGYVFTSTITSEDAAKIFSKDIPWYGPCYIASNCPTVMVGVAE